ncbi:Bifunctional purine biosynthesis protein PurH [Kickxella alabastrina]|uniref:Bifunctional purine biosynthesis protein PurH n=1 Tax=Kickxella alabastrina TaxID=61397 RepID=A0ACC1IM23_9FUNG|nr:Bifunctional purine biosynthesis protein PurH [Kickxella alabastrina]
MGATNLPGDIISKCKAGPSHLINHLPSCIPVSDIVWGLAVGSFALGALVGALSCTRYSNIYGRKTVLLYSNALSIASALLFMFSVNIAMLVIARVLIGIAAGMANVTFTIYIVEITTTKARSSLGSMTQMAVMFGIMLAQLLSLSMLTPPLWRLLLAMPGVISIFSIVLLFYCAESPKWLIMNGQPVEALNALQQLRKDSDCSAEFKHMVNTAREEMGPDACTVSIVDVLRGNTPDNLQHQLLVSSMMMVFQQASGISGVAFYSTALFNTVTGDSNSVFSNSPTTSQVLTGVLSTVGAAMNLVGMLLSVHFPRRTLLLFSHFAMGLCSILISVGSIKGVNPLAITMVFVYFSVFSVGCGPIPWVSPSEMTPTYAVAAIGAISGSINFICIFAIGLVFSPLLDALDGYTFLLFAATNFTAVLFFFFFLPETKDLYVADVVRVHSVGIHNVVSARFKMTVASPEKDAIRTGSA